MQISASHRLIQAFHAHLHPNIERMLLAESSILAGLGGIAGILIAFWAVSVIRPFFPAELTTLGPV